MDSEPGKGTDIKVTFDAYRKMNNDAVEINECWFGIL